MTALFVEIVWQSKCIDLKLIPSDENANNDKQKQQQQHSLQSNGLFRYDEDNEEYIAVVNGQVSVMIYCDIVMLAMLLMRSNCDFNLL
jgi:hypothetical protein